MPTVTLPKINANLAYQFLGVEDCGPMDCGRGSGTCPHCGAEGRYIYHWAEYGVVRGAMAGCFRALTGALNRDETAEFYRTMAERQAKNKPLNGWQKTVLRMQQFIAEGKFSEEWCNQKIREAICEQRRFAFSKGR